MQLKQLGPYEIGESLGKGGMGSVYAATNTQTGQRVAIKVLTPHLALAEGFRERFEAEIESLKTLRHDGIVRLYGYGEQDGVLFYSMELVEGTSLEDELKAGRRFNWRDVTNIAIQLALALKHAHDHGVIHRDIKPANILLSADEHVKLADFGIARLFGSSQLTTAGGVLGTADYMSPEQADGRPVTSRCDQYSLGGVMYALLAGRPPFRAKNLPQMLQLQRFAEPEPVRRFAPDTPEQLERVIMQLLAKEPAERFPNTQVLARHLRAMYMALSRPAPDDFALAGDGPAVDRTHEPLDHSILTARTQEEPATARPLQKVPTTANKTIPPDAPAADEAEASHDAATLAADGTGYERSPRADATSARSITERGEQAPPAAPPSPPSRPTHFTTVAEADALQAADARAWLVVGGQLAALVAVLGCMIGAFFYLTRPTSADELYRAITSTADIESGDSLLPAETQIREFLRRFPNDPRVEKLREYERLLILDQAERRLQRTTQRGVLGNGASLLPAERLYLQGVDVAYTSPEKGIALFEALIALYGTPHIEEGGDTASNEQRKQELVCVQLAERRLEPLRAAHKDFVEQHLASLHERMEAAEKLAASNPARAATLYRALIDLHQQDAWAAEIVAEARSRLEVIQTPE